MTQNKQLQEVKSNSIPPPQVPRYMPLIQQKNVKKLEVVHENQSINDLPEINVKNSQVIEQFLSNSQSRQKERIESLNFEQNNERANRSITSNTNLQPNLNSELESLNQKQISILQTSSNRAAGMGFQSACTESKSAGRFS
mmetsp:Transcript_9744/g.16413  ORF Transcript_9744/g.16413 Transcript_9744/m.16413 type:complete len:141 (+) Transcript_9744:253-675(+)